VAQVKCVNEQEFVIGGYTDPQGQRVGFGALPAGHYERKKLRYAGKVGTGYDTSALKRMHQQLTSIESDRMFFDDKVSERQHVHWVKPRLVAQIGFS
jgi:bifunctional non-homologous end joining protein LigD